jgi:hypothetical protein
MVMIRSRLCIILLTAVSLCYNVVSQDTEIDNDLLMDTFIFFPPRASPKNDETGIQFVKSNQIGMIDRTNILPTMTNQQKGDYRLL